MICEFYNEAQLDVLIESPIESMFLLFSNLKDFRAQNARNHITVKARLISSLYPVTFTIESVCMYSIVSSISLTSVLKSKLHRNYKSEFSKCIGYGSLLKIKYKHSALEIRRLVLSRSQCTLRETVLSITFSFVKFTDLSRTVTFG